MIILELKAEGFCVLGQSLLHNETLCETQTNPTKQADSPYRLFIHSPYQLFTELFTLTSQRTERGEDLPVWNFLNYVNLAN